MAIDTLAASLSRRLPASVIVVDRSKRLLAYAEHEDSADACRIRTIMHRGLTAEERVWFEGLGHNDDVRPFVLPANPRFASGPRLCVPAVHEGRVQAYAMLAPDPGVDVDELDVDAATPFVSAIAAELVQRDRERGQLEGAIRVAVSDSPTDPDTAKVLVNAGLLGSAGVLLLASEDTLSVPAPTSAACRLDSHVVTVVPLHAPVSKLAADLKQLVPPEIRVGMSASRSMLDDLRSPWREALLALEVGTFTRTEEPISSWDELGLYQLAIQDPAVLRPVLPLPVRALLEHKNADLWSTTLAYLERAGDAAATATELNIHRQTLYYRLRRTEEITGLSLTSGADRLALHFGLTLGRFLLHLGIT